jgi:fumarylacetoacetase
MPDADALRPSLDAPPPEVAETLDPAIESFVPGSGERGADFPIQNLPLGVFSTAGDPAPRIGVAIGDHLLDLRGAVEAGLLDGLAGEIRCSLAAASLNDHLALGRPRWIECRRAISRLLRADEAALRDHARRDALLPHRREAAMHLPVRCGDYTDFYASLHHATNVGSMFRPDQPLMPNWKHLPVGYHGRASSLVPSGTPVRRPFGQSKPADAETPRWGPCRLLDYELEVGFVVGPGNALGARIPVERAIDHLYGVVLVNDWSARDVQAWEYQPLGPFNAKNFATTASPWVVSFEALRPFLAAGPPRSEGDPENLPYLVRPGDFQPDLSLSVEIVPASLRGGGAAITPVGEASYREMYWTPSQMVAHHTSTGCDLRPGDLLASGTVSGPSEASRGCLLERTWRGKHPITLDDGSTRTFLADGDEVVLRGWCERAGARRIGLGECRGVVLPAEA